MVLGIQAMRKLFSFKKCLFVFICLLSVSFNINAERIRLDREHGTVNSALQEMLSEQIALFTERQGKIELGRVGGSKSSCMADLFVSPETIFVVVESTKSKAEFYIDHPHDSFKDVLFQALVKRGKQSELSVDKKTESYKFIKDGDNLSIEAKQQGNIIECKFNLSKATLISGETE
jgi:hypothetical protein